MHKPTFITRDFVSALQPHADKTLVFEYDGKRIQPGYHVTEIKAASFRSLDCGANPQQWNETIVQLWDVADEPERGHMSTKKFLGIWNKVHRDVGLDEAAEIKFECGDAQTPAVHYTFESMHEEGGSVVVSLEPVRATCKPRDRWWMDADGAVQADACCTPGAGASQSVIGIGDIAFDGALATSVRAQSCCN